MLYFSKHWNYLEVENASFVVGAMQIASRGRKNAPIVLTYALNEQDKCWEYEIFTVPTVKLADMSDEPEHILKARSNQRAIELLNIEGDAGAADILSDLAQGRKAGGSNTKILFKGKVATTMSASIMQRFLQETTKEILNEEVWFA